MSFGRADFIRVEERMSAWRPKKNGDNPNNMLVEYKPGTTFPGVIGRTVDEASPAWPAPLRAKEGAPNVLFILDVTGKTRSIKAEERAFLSTATVGPAGI